MGVVPISKRELNRIDVLARLSSPPFAAARAFNEMLGLDIQLQIAASGGSSR
jgi:hypothetical protein